jgi:sulfate adenylyltransferase subunit 2
MRLHDDVLGSLEAEAIQIFREVVAECERPVLLFSAGKDSAVLLHLARKAFFPAMPPFPLLHVDTMWKFREMYAFRDQAAAAAGMTLRVHRNPEAEAEGINPFDHGASVHTDIWKTQGLKQALDAGRFDAAFGGARRDEEKSRAKERIVSVRTAAQGWDPKRQRPELWSLYNTRLQDGESVRVFPLSNWIELDIWRYIQRENIALPSLYFAAERPVLERDGALLVLDDDRMPLRPGEAARMRRVRFRTLGCWPLTAAVESDADTLEAIAREISDASLSERQGRAIDHDPSASMERKKREGYF